MNPRPLISIGIPVYNAAPWLRQAIESALAQDWSPKEVLVLDDGSTDESPGIIRSFGEAIEAISTPNRGQIAASNTLLARMRGEWLQFLDADDYLLPQKLSVQVAEAGDLSSLDLLASPVWREDHHRGGERRLSFDPATRPADPCRQILFVQALQTNGGLWRKAALERIGGWSEPRLATDTAAYCRAIRHGLRIRMTPSANVVYRIGLNPESVSQTNWARTNVVKLELFLEMMQWMQQRGEWSAEIHDACAHHTFLLVRQMAGHDLALARNIEARLRAAHLWHPSEIGHRRWAPRGYAFLYRLLGFRTAEWLSHKLRRPSAA